VKARNSRRIATLLLGVVVLTLNACGTDQAPSAKRLGDQPVCQLISAADMGAILGATVTEPKVDGPQCSYDSANQTSVGVAKAQEAARSGASTTVDSVKARKQESLGGEGCAIDVILVDNDPKQLFSVSTVFGPDAVQAFGKTACQSTEKVAAKILQGLPS
jgi:hypothetical protein